MCMSVHLISILGYSKALILLLWQYDLSHVYGQLQVHVQPGQGPEARLEPNMPA